MVDFNTRYPNIHNSNNHKKEDEQTFNTEQSTSYTNGGNSSKVSSGLPLASTIPLPPPHAIMSLPPPITSAMNSQGTSLLYILNNQGNPVNSHQYASHRKDTNLQQPFVFPPLNSQPQHMMRQSSSLSSERHQPQPQPVHRLTHSVGSLGNFPFKAPTITTNAPIITTNAPSTNNNTHKAPDSSTLANENKFQSQSYHMGNPSPSNIQYVRQFSHHLNPSFAVNLKFTRDLNTMTQDWTLQEVKNRRRLVKFDFHNDTNNMQQVINFEPIEAIDSNNAHAVISCIYWREMDKYICTSVDIILLLEYLVLQSFGIEEKNRIRRNLQSLKPKTVSRSNKEDREFFSFIMSMENPRPRNIEKDLKVFNWSDLGKAITKVMSKYYVVTSPSLTSTIRGTTSAMTNPISSEKPSQNIPKSYNLPTPHHNVSASFPPLYHTADHQSSYIAPPLPLQQQQQQQQSSSSSSQSLHQHQQHQQHQHQHQQHHLHLHQHQQHHLHLHHHQHHHNHNHIQYQHQHPNAAPTPDQFATLVPSPYVSTVASNIGDYSNDSSSGEQNSGQRATLEKARAIKNNNSLGFASVPFSPQAFQSKQPLHPLQYNQYDSVSPNNNNNSHTPQAGFQLPPLRSSFTLNSNSDSNTTPFSPFELSNGSSDNSTTPPDFVKASTVSSLSSNDSMDELGASNRSNYTQNYPRASLLTSSSSSSSSSSSFKPVQPKNRYFPDNRVSNLHCPSKNLSFNSLSAKFPDCENNSRSERSSGTEDGDVSTASSGKNCGNTSLKNNGKGNSSTELIATRDTNSLLSLHRDSGNSSECSSRSNSSTGYNNGSKFPSSKLEPMVISGSRNGSKNNFYEPAGNGNSNHSLFQEEVGGDEDEDGSMESGTPEEVDNDNNYEANQMDIDTNGDGCDIKESKNKQMQMRKRKQRHGHRLRGSTSKHNLNYFNENKDERELTEGSHGDTRPKLPSISQLLEPSVHVDSISLPALTDNSVPESKLPSISEVQKWKGF
ncbi:hypothetical protein KGF56_003226 [Candida oxycetoniae]|uniref:DUF7082 domain-containing protein n=1 Tax=Candida oxycetoniae TaxID=497107 RepID=A0AAI9WXF9_9ASCO|nr:uncharacterized protein KGF56_003226 [Candida oxycetoniae]KAI3403959.2 hypothetical protein KGF56_003226 [Candida oxycetoniae]